MIFLWARGRHPLLVMLLLALYGAIAIRFWYIAVPVLAALIAIDVARSRTRRHMHLVSATALDSLYTLNPEHFEQRVLAILEANGWSKLLWVGGMRDRGADVTGVDPEGRFCVVQAKRYRPDATIGSSVVQTLIGSMVIYGADRAVLVTTGRFTSHARELAAQMDVELVDGSRLVALARAREAA